MVGELSPEVDNCFRNYGRRNGAADNDNENMIWKESEACMEGHLDCGD